MLNVIGQPQPLLSKLLEEFSDNGVPIGLGQLQTPLRPPSVLRRGTRHEREGKLSAAGHQRPICSSGEGEINHNRS
jgi:hypothetical protein